MFTIQCSRTTGSQDAIKMHIKISNYSTLFDPTKAIKPAARFSSCFPSLFFRFFRTLETRRRHRKLMRKSDKHEKATIGKLKINWMRPLCAYVWRLAYILIKSDGFWRVVFVVHFNILHNIKFGIVLKFISVCL